MKQKKLSNWGKWGKKDQLGTLNYITSTTVKEAASLVRKGKIYSLSCVLGGDGPYFVGSLRGQPWRITAVRSVKASKKVSFAEDMITVSTHSGTHIDALSHFCFDGLMYNGFDATEIDGTGTGKNSIENLKFLIGRGIMLDVAGNKGTLRLDPGYAITVNDLEDCLRAKNLKTKSGDILLVRTGWMGIFQEKGPSSFKGGNTLEDIKVPGLSADVAGWLHENQTCAVGVDNWSCEVFPPEQSGHTFKFHEIFLRDLGGYVMEALILDELARDQVYEFLFIVAPLQISRGVGSPVNPLALV
jgi:kynurenine formamidase